MKKSLLEQMQAHLEQISDADFAVKWAACADVESAGPSLAQYLNMSAPCEYTVVYEEQDRYKVAGLPANESWLPTSAPSNSDSGNRQSFFCLNIAIWKPVQYPQPFGFQAIK